MFSGLEEQRARSVGKKNKGRTKREKKLVAAKSGLVGKKGCFKTHDCVKYILPFLNETAFYAKSPKRFSGPKHKFT